MNELLEQLKSKVGLDDEQAGGALATVIEFIQDKLPAPIAAQLAGLIGMGGGDDDAEGGDAGGLGDLADKAKDALGGMFGGDK